MKNLILSVITFTFIFNSSIAQNGLNFEGPSDILQSNYPGVVSNANRTFEAWIYVSSSAPTANLAILDYGVNSVGSRNTFAVSASRALTFTSGGTNANIATGASAVPLDQWTHVAFVLNSGTGYLYVDGVQEGTGSLTSVNTPSGNENVKFGQRVSGGSIPFHGKMDELRIWNTARTQAEILANMNIELCSTDPNLQLYLRLNEGVADGTNTSVTNAIDHSGNGYVSTLNAFALTGTTSNWTTGVALTPGYSLASITETACDSYTWAANSTTYTTSGNYSTVLTGSNVSGCDSIISLDLTINTANDLTTNVSACDSYTWSVNGMTYTTSTTVIEPQQTGAGCDYNHTLVLNIGQSTTESMDVTSCDSYTWSANGQTYITSGSYTEVLSNVDGCDSTVTLNLTINTVDNGVTDNGDLSITANDANATYQWLDCDNNNAVIPGATSQTYIATANGNYAVEVTSNGCTDTSDCVSIDIVGINDLNEINVIQLFPNPTKSTATLVFEKQITSGTVEVSDASGRLINTVTLHDKNEVSMEISGDAGIYFIRINDESNNSTTLRLIKE